MTTPCGPGCKEHAADLPTRLDEALKEVARAWQAAGAKLDEVATKFQAECDELRAKLRAVERDRDEALARVAAFEAQRKFEEALVPRILGRSRGQLGTALEVCLEQRDAAEQELAKAQARADTAERKQVEMAEELTAAEAAVAKANKQLLLVYTSVEGVWKWQGEGDAPESLTCPVVMSADTLRGLINAPPDRSLCVCGHPEGEHSAVEGDRFCYVAPCDCQKFQPADEDLPLHTGRHDNEAAKALGEVYRHGVGVGSIGVVEATTAKRVLAHAYAERDHLASKLGSAQDGSEGRRLAIERLERELAEEVNARLDLEADLTNFGLSMDDGVLEAVRAPRAEWPNVPFTPEGLKQFRADTAQEREKLRAKAFTTADLQTLRAGCHHSQACLIKMVGGDVGCSCGCAAAIVLLAGKAP